jgi:hypothetical protein
MQAIAAQLRQLYLGDRPHLLSELIDIAELTVADEARFSLVGGLRARGQVQDRLPN